MQLIGLICCRGGSKGIPGKNIRPFAGKPLLRWIGEAAVAAGVFADIILSTDAPDIAAVGEAAGLTVPGLRPSELASDAADQFDTHKYVFDQLGINDVSHRVCILNNNPFIDAPLIVAAADAARTDDYEHLVLDAVPVDGDYLHFRHCELNDGRLTLRFPDDMMASSINRQGYAPTYTTMNNLRFGRPSVLREYDVYKEAWLAGVVPVMLPKERNFDIDTEDDWRIAEAVFRVLIA